jgi:phosphinothricin acetyltransferase
MLQCSVLPEDVASLRLHEAAGFRRVGTRERIARMTYRPIAGQWRDTVLLERRSQKPAGDLTSTRLGRPGAAGAR